MRLRKVVLSAGLWLEGPILGAILLFAIQTTFTPGGPWYLVGLDATAALFALVLPRGLWGTIEALPPAPAAGRLLGGREEATKRKKKKADSLLPPEDLMLHPGHLLRRALQAMNLLWGKRFRTP